MTSLCEGEGLGILGPKDEAGCSTTCVGCQNTAGMINNYLSQVA